MSKGITTFLLIIFLSLHSRSLEESPTYDLYDQQSIKISNNSKTVIAKLNFNDWPESEQDKKYINLITVSNNNENYPVYIFLSTANQPPSRNSFIAFSSLPGQNEISVPIEKFNIAKANVYFECPEDDYCDFNLFFYYQEYFIIDKNQIFQSFLTPDTSITAVILCSDNKNEDLLNVFAVAQEAGILSVTLHFVQTNGEPKTQEIKMLDNKIHNGKIIFFDENEYSDNESNFFQLEISSTEKTVVTFGAKVINRYNTIKLNYPSIYGYLPGKTQDSIACYKIEENNEKSKNNPYSINIVTKVGSLAVLFGKQNEKEELEFKQDRHILVELQEDIIFYYEDREKFPYICIESDIEGGEIGFTIQATELVKEKTSGALLDPVLNGIIYKKILIANQTQFYRHNKHETTVKSTDFNIRSTGGLILPFIARCKEFPLNCNYDFSSFEKNENIIFLEDIAGFSTYNVKKEDDGNIYSSDQQFLVVMCGSDSCTFEISFFDEEESLYLTENSLYTQIIESDETDHLIVSVRNKLIDRIVILFYTISGKTNIFVNQDSKCKPTITYYGNNQIIEYKKDNNCYDIIQDYKININTPEGAIYSIEYSAYEPGDKDFNFQQIVPNFLLHQHINKNEEIKIYGFQSVLSQFNAPIVTMVRSLNCPLNVTIRYITQEVQSVVISPYGTYQLEIFPSTIENYDNSGIRLEIAGNEDAEVSHCEYYSGILEVLNIDELDVHSEIVLSEEEPFKFNLTRTTDGLTLMFPFMNMDKNFHKVTIRINTLNEALLGVKLYFNNKTNDKREEIINRNKILLLDEFTVRKNCYEGQLCLLKIQVNSYDLKLLDEGIKFEISVKTQNSMPTYLPKEYLINDLVFTDKIQYYYADIPENEEGEVMLNFKRGTGIMFGKMTKKKFTEEKADWNHKIKLPVEDDSDLLIFVPFIKKILYTKEDTENCGKEGCELIIGVKPEEMYIMGFQDEYISDYSIFRKHNNLTSTNPEEEKPGIVRIFQDEYIIGSLFKEEKNVVDFDFYSIIVPYEIDSMDIELQSEVCNVYIVVNEKPIDIDTFENNGKNMIINFPKEKFYSDKVKKTKGQEVTIAFNAKNINSFYYAFYSFRVSFHKQGFPHYSLINSEEAAICMPNKDKKYCDFVIPLDIYNNINNLYLYAYSDGLRGYTIYTKIINQYQFDTLSADDMKKEFDDVLKEENLNDKKFNSKGEFNQAFLSIDLFHLFPQDYVLVRVTATQMEEFMLLNTFRTFLQSVTPEATSDTLFNVEMGGNITIKIPNDKEYSIHINGINSTGYVCFENEPDKKYKVEVSDSLTLYTKPPYMSNIVVSSIKNDTNFTFYFFYDIKPYENNDEIYYSTSGEIVYSDKEIKFPLMYYTKVEDEDEDLTIDFSLLNFEPSNTNLNLFTITGFLADSKEISERKRNIEYKFNNKTIIPGVYDPSIESGFIIFPKKSIKEFNGDVKYIFAQVEKNSTNKNIYTQITAQINQLTNDNQNTLLPHNKYFIGSIIETNVTAVYLLTKSTKDEQWLYLEFSTPNVLTLNFALNANRMEKQNSTNIEKTKTKRENGKVRVYYKMKEEKEIYLNVFSKEGEKHLNFRFKYQTSVNLISNKYTIEKNISVNEGKTADKDLIKPVTIKFKKVQINNSNVKSKYTVKLYNYKEGEKLYTKSIAPINIEAKAEIPVADINGTDYCEVNITNLPKGDYIGSIIAITLDNDREILIYDQFTIPKGLKIPFDDLDGGKSKSELHWYLVLMIIVMIIVLILIIIIIFITLKKRASSTKSVESAKLLTPEAELLPDIVS